MVAARVTQARGSAAGRWARGRLADQRTGTGIGAAPRAVAAAAALDGGSAAGDGRRLDLGARCGPGTPARLVDRRSGRPEHSNQGDVREALTMREAGTDRTMTSGDPRTARIVLACLAEPGSEAIYQLVRAHGPAGALSRVLAGEASGRANRPWSRRRARLGHAGARRNRRRRTGARQAGRRPGGGTGGRTSGRRSSPTSHSSGSPTVTGSPAVPTRRYASGYAANAHWRRRSRDPSRWSAPHCPAPTATTSRPNWRTGWPTGAGRWCPVAPTASTPTVHRKRDGRGRGQRRGPGLWRGPRLPVRARRPLRRASWRTAC